MSAGGETVPEEGLIGIGWVVGPRIDHYTEEYLDRAAVLGLAVVEAVMAAAPATLPPTVAALAAALDRLEENYALRQSLMRAEGPPAPQPEVPQQAGVLYR